MNEDRELWPKYSVDMVLCIDSCSSMSMHLERVKINAIEYSEILNRCSTELGKFISNFRVKVISYGDYLVDGKQSTQILPFYCLPNEQLGFQEFIRGIRPAGGSSNCHSGLEALALAIHSDWKVDNFRRRQIIVIWTDSAAYPLEAYKQVNNSKVIFPETFYILTGIWEESMDYKYKRLILYAPDVYPWINISDCWSKTIHYPSTAGEGLQEIDSQAILDLLLKELG